MRNELHDFFTALGWKPKGRYLYFTRPDSVRLRIALGERSLTFACVRNGMAMRLGGDYYSRVVKLPGNLLRVGTLVFGEGNADGMGSARK